MTTAPVQIRSARPKSTNPDDFDAVSARVLEWKFSPLDKIQSLIEADLDGSVFPYEVSHSGDIELSWIDSDDARVGSAGIPEDRPSARAWKAAKQVLLINLKNSDVNELTFTRNMLGDAPRAAHIVINAEPFSKSTVILQHYGDASLIENVEIVVGESAQLKVISLQEWSDSAIHLSSHFARVAKQGTLHHSVISLGGSVVRINPSSLLAGEGSFASMNGLYFSRSGQHIEHQVFVHHEAPQTTSRVNYKGALQGAGARTVWIGDVLIGNKAVGTDSYEQNRNLVLTDGTRADSIPNLEIETGDIAGAGHASATGRFDDEQLFYLQARGIDEAEARRLVVQGFLNEIIQQLEVPSLEEKLQKYLGEQLEVEVA